MLVERADNVNLTENLVVNKTFPLNVTLVPRDERSAIIDHASRINYNQIFV